MRTTLKDVAREAGVSHMTVSRVINNKGSIERETRERVQRAVDKLNYRPNNIARSLVSRKTQLIGILVPDIDNPFFSCMVRSSEKIAQERGYNIILGDTGGTVHNEKKYLDILLGRMVDGVVMVAPRLDDQTLVRYAGQLPLVIVDRYVEDASIPQIWVDNEKGACLAMEYLIGLGHRRIGFITGPETVQSSRKREEGYRSSLRRHGIDEMPDLVIVGDFLLEAGYRSIDGFYQLSQPPTAIFSSNDIMALGMIKRARERRIRIPGDLSIVGFDNISVSSLIDPPLTTIDHPVQEMGCRAINILLDEIVQEKGRESSIQLENRLVVRQSAVRI